MLSITLYGQPTTKKNSSQIIKVGNRKKLIPSEQYLEYEKACLWQIPPKAKRRIEQRVNVKTLYYMQTRRAVDLINLQEATCDILVKAGVLMDDNSRIVAAHDGSRVRYDKLNPRVEITITEMHDD